MGIWTWKRLQMYLTYRFSCSCGSKTSNYMYIGRTTRALAYRMATHNATEKPDLIAEGLCVLPCLALEVIFSRILFKANHQCILLLLNRSFPLDEGPTKGLGNKSMINR